MKPTTTMSRAINQLERIYNVLNTDYWAGELPVPVITVQTVRCSNSSPTGVWQRKEDSAYELVIPLTRNCASQQKITHALLTNRYLDSPSRALCEQIITLDKKMLIRRVGYVDDAFERLSIRHALSKLLAIDGVA